MCMRRLLIPMMLTFVSTVLCAQSGTLVVLNKSEHTASLINVENGKTIATVPTGSAPHEVAISPDGRLAVVANYGTATPGSSLTVIDLSTTSVLREIDLGEYRRPHGILWLGEPRNIAVTAEGNKVLLVVDIEKGTVLSAIETDQDISHMVAVTPDFSKAFVTNIRSGSVTVIDLSAKKRLSNIPTGAGAEGIDVSPNGKEVWITNRSANTITVLGTKTLEKVADVVCADFPIRVKFTPDGRHVLVSNARSGDVAVFDAGTKKEVRRIKMELSAARDADTRLFGTQFGTSPVPIGILIPPDGKRAYVANTNADIVTVIDLATWEITERIKTGKEPDGLGYSTLELK
ncbi:MAG: hypothetical protein FJ215_01310 [Ignavibacteria bacterium]|nr:hypothetical protein [Ignavibacteria bacterium]